MGANSLLPGSINQKEPNILKIKGIKKNLRNLFEIKFANR